MVNGAKPLAHEALPGDVIEIPANDTATLHPGGDEVYVASLSSATYVNRGHVELTRGTTKITTKTGVAVHVHHYTVTPTAPISNYQVMWSDTGGRVQVYEGEVRIDGCQKKLNLPKDKIAELGKDCKLGAYLRPEGGRVDTLALVVPAVPLLCYYRCKDDESGQCMQEKSGCSNH